MDQSLFEFHVVPSFKDYLRFNFHVLFRMLGFALLVPVTLIVGIVLSFHFNPPQGDLWSYLCSLPIFPSIIILVFLLIPIRVYFAARHRWHTASELSGPRTFRFSEAGISVDAATFNGFTSWDHIRSVESTGNLIALRKTQPLYFLIPIDSFTDSALLFQFKEFLRTKVPEYSRLK